jgi:hypothetical protein
MKFTLDITFFLFAVLIPFSAFAYLGPGAGLSAIGSVLAFVGLILLLILGFFWYPLKKLMKRMKSHTDQETDDDDDSDSPEF